MSTWKDLRLLQERQKDIERDIERWRQIDEARGVRRRPGRIQRVYGLALARVGGVLMAWGARLKGRYGQFSAEDYLAAELELILRRSRANNAEGGSYTATL